jgi:hypothetical protein
LLEFPPETLNFHVVHSSSFCVHAAPNFRIFEDSGETWALKLRILIGV